MKIISLMLNNAKVFNQYLSYWDTKNVKVSSKFSFNTIQWKFPKPNLLAFNLE